MFGVCKSSYTDSLLCCLALILTHFVFVLADCGTDRTCCSVITHKKSNCFLYIEASRRGSGLQSADGIATASAGEQISQ